MLSPSRYIKLLSLTPIKPDRPSARPSRPRPSQRGEWGDRGERGAFTLASLMLLLLLMGMTTLLGARLLLGEQMGSEALVQGQQRVSLQESALDWGLALLNGATPDADCAPGDVDASPGKVAPPFPDSLTRTDEQGRRHVLPAWQATPLRCSIADGVWHCRCAIAGAIPAAAGASTYAAARPSLSGTPVSARGPAEASRAWPGLTVTPVAAPSSGGVEVTTKTKAEREADGIFTDQRAQISLEFQGLERPDAVGWRRRTLQLLGRACAEGQALCNLPGTAVSSPLPDSGQVQLIALASALAEIPGSAVVGAGSVDLSGLATTQAGIALPPNAHTAWAVQSGASILGATEGRLQGPVGSSAASLQRAHEPELAGPSVNFFRRHFGLPPADYAAHPALTVLECHDVPDCAPALAEKLRIGRTWLWIRGALRLRSAIDIGSSTHPALLICDAGVDIDGAVRLTGLLYSHGATRLSAAADPLRIEGALLSAGPSTLIGHVQVLHNPAVLRRLADLHGSWIRLPGGWRS